MDISFLAVLVAAIASFAVGALWYGPLFGRYWMGLMNFTPESMRAMKLTGGQAMAMGAVAQLVTAYVLAHFVAALNIGTVLGALELSLWIWAGFLATQALGAYLWEGKPFKLAAFNAAHLFAALLASTLVLALWR